MQQQEQNFQDHLIDVVSIFERYIPNLRSKKTRTHGGEWCGRCPLAGCSSHDDAFLLWPNRAAGDGPLWSCRKCGQSGRLRKFLKLVDPANYRSLCLEYNIPFYGDEPLAAREHKAPYAGLHLLWKDAAYWLARECQAALWDGSDISNKWLAWLKWRGFTEATIKRAGLGLNKTTRYDNPADWGIEEEGRKAVWIPRGVVIPWKQGDQLIKINIRRSDADVKRDEQAGKRKAKYVEITGSDPDPLYGLDSILDNEPLAVCEGEFDKLALEQALGNARVGIVATGSAKRGLTEENVEQLARSSMQLLLFDFDEAGDDGTQEWLDVLPRAHMWSPYIPGYDVNDLLKDKEDVSTWFWHGIDDLTKTLPVSISRTLDVSKSNDMSVTTSNGEKSPESQINASYIVELTSKTRCRECNKSGVVYDGVNYWCAWCALTVFLQGENSNQYVYEPPLLDDLPMWEQANNETRALLHLLLAYMRPHAHEALDYCACFACGSVRTQYDLHGRLWCAKHAPEGAGDCGMSLPFEPEEVKDAEYCYLCKREVDEIDLHLRSYCAGCTPTRPYIDTVTLQALARVAAQLEKQVPEGEAIQARPCMVEVCQNFAALEDEATHHSWCEEHSRRALLLDMLNTLGWPKLAVGAITLESGQDNALAFAFNASQEEFVALLSVVNRHAKGIPDPVPPKVVDLQERKRQRRTCDYDACNQRPHYVHSSGLAFCVNPGCELRYAFLLKSEAQSYPEVRYVPAIKQLGEQVLHAGIEKHKSFALHADWRDVERVIAALEK